VHPAASTSQGYFPWPLVVLEGKLKGAFHNFNLSRILSIVLRLLSERPEMDARERPSIALRASCKILTAPFLSSDTSLVVIAKARQLVRRAGSVALKYLTTCRLVEPRVDITQFAWRLVNSRCLMERFERSHTNRWKFASLRETV
jgi:hypothetical protein